MTPRIFSLGHSTHPIDVFVGLLRRHEVGVLADIRRFPGSRTYPQFNQDALRDSLQDAGIEYRWFEALGGRRGKSKTESSRNLALRNESFRNYADYMLTDAFRAAIDELLQLAAARPTAILCSESVYWRCHRRLVSDFLLLRGTTVEHIMPTGGLKPHEATPEARFDGDEVTYPSPQEPNRLLF